MTRRPVVHDHAARDEAEANEFAMCLLMPADFLEQEVGLVLDPFTGSGTVGAVALRLHRRFLGIELNPTYAAMATRRIQASVPGPSLFLNAQATA